MHWHNGYFLQIYLCQQTCGLHKPGVDFFYRFGAYSQGGICRLKQWAEERMEAPSIEALKAPSIEAPKAPRGYFLLLNLEMACFGAHLRYSDVLVLKFCLDCF